MERESALLNRWELLTEDGWIPRTPRAPLRLGIPPLDAAAPWVPGGSVFLLVGPPMEEKEEWLHRFLRQGLKEGDGAILVSTGIRGEECWRRFRESGMGLEPVRNRVGIVDCASLRDDFPEWRTEPVRCVSSPLNFPGITAAVEEFMEGFRRWWGVRRCRFAIHSLSTLLTYSDLRQAFRFLHAFNCRVRATGGLALHVLQQGTLDSRVLSAMEALADGVIEARPGSTFALLRRGPGPGAGGAA